MFLVAENKLWKVLRAASVKAAVVQAATTVASRKATPA